MCEAEQAASSLRAAFVKFRFAALLANRCLGAWEAKSGAEKERLPQRAFPTAVALYSSSRVLIQCCRAVFMFRLAFPLMFFPELFGLTLSEVWGVSQNDAPTGKSFRSVSQSCVTCRA